ncbi:MAG TPA: isochorismatase family protein, partial [Pyrinomonadaceae bacterium]|nr:isochorismatase family protein [Pyrinomonadaceae bacterium]
PILVTEQYPRGLGHTVEEIKAALPSAVTPLEKTAFSACGAAGFTNYLQQSSVQQIIVCGVETHVCVNQTTHDLLDRGYQVHVLADAVASRAPEDKQIAFAKMQAGGALLSSTEMALFELLRDASHAQFKAVQQLIK